MKWQVYEASPALQKAFLDEITAGLAILYPLSLPWTPKKNKEVEACIRSWHLVFAKAAKGAYVEDLQHIREVFLEVAPLLTEWVKPFDIMERYKIKHKLFLEAKEQKEREQERKKWEQSLPRLSQEGEDLKIVELREVTARLFPRRLKNKEVFNEN